VKEQLQNGNEADAEKPNRMKIEKDIQVIAKFLI
jgi:hypothetical protein